MLVNAARASAPRYSERDERGDDREHDRSFHDDVEVVEVVLQDRDGARDRDPDPEGRRRTTGTRESFTALVWPPVRPMLVRSVDTRNTPVNAEIAASHRSCCRSSPVDRWNRWTSPTTAAIDRPASPSPPTQTATSRAPCSAGDTEGILRLGRRRHVDRPRAGTSPRAPATTSTSISASGNQRHARDGSRPVGNSSRIKGTAATTRNAQLFTQATADPERQRARRGFQRVLGVFRRRSARAARRARRPGTASRSGSAARATPARPPSPHT